MPCVELGDVMRAATIGIVEASNNAAWPVGMHVLGFGGVCDFYVGIPGVNVFYPAGECAGLSLTADLSLCSIIVGLTAWYGVKHVLNVQAGDVVVVSGSAGAVGSLVGQLAKLKGAKVCGIAGGATKCAWLKSLGYDAVIDYKDVASVAAAVKEFAGGEGVTCYFDNVGGVITDDVLTAMRNNGKVAVCGSISEYDDNWTGQKNWNLILMRRLSVQGYAAAVGGAGRGRGGGAGLPHQGGGGRAAAPGAVRGVSARRPAVRLRAAHAQRSGAGRAHARAVRSAVRAGGAARQPGSTLLRWEATSYLSKFRKQT